MKIINKQSKRIAIVTIGLLYTLTNYGYAQLTDLKDKNTVKEFINLIKERKVSSLADHVYYPLKREYPLSPIRNKQEFIKRFQEVFDDSLATTIVSSDPEKDWSQMGWRGIMLKQGLIWLDKNLIAVNYQSKTERQLIEKLIVKDKLQLYPGLKNYKKPLLFMQTSKFTIRIDEMKNGNLRYASWSVGTNQSTKPNLVIDGGIFTADGSGGNHYYEFSKGIYKYQCYVFVMSENGTPPAQLQVIKGNKKILEQNSLILKN